MFLTLPINSILAPLELIITLLVELVQLDQLGEVRVIDGFGFQLLLLLLDSGVFSDSSFFPFSFPVFPSTISHSSVGR